MVSYRILPVSISVTDVTCPRRNETFPPFAASSLELPSSGEEQKA